MWRESEEIEKERKWREGEMDSLQILILDLSVESLSAVVWICGRVDD